MVRNLGLKEKKVRVYKLIPHLPSKTLLLSRQTYSSLIIGNSSRSQLTQHLPEFYLTLLPLQTPLRSETDDHSNNHLVSLVPDPLRWRWRLDRSYHLPRVKKMEKVFRLYSTTNADRSSVSLSLFFLAKVGRSLRIYPRGCHSLNFPSGRVVSKVLGS